MILTLLRPPRPCLGLMRPMIKRPASLCRGSRRSKLVQITWSRQSQWRTQTYLWASCLTIRSLMKRARMVSSQMTAWIQNQRKWQELILVADWTSLKIAQIQKSIFCWVHRTHSSVASKGAQAEDMNPLLQWKVTRALKDPSQSRKSPNSPWQTPKWIMASRS